MTARAPLLITCLGVEHDLPLLPHFLQHYLRLGILAGDIHIILNARDGTFPGMDTAREILARHNVHNTIKWIAPYTSDAMWEKRRQVQSQVAGQTNWLLSADIDEMHEYPEPLPTFLARCERLGVDAVQGPLIDRLAPEGRLAPVAADTPLAAQYPIEAAVMERLGGESYDRRGTVKLMAMRGSILPSRGGHRPQRHCSPHHLYGLALGDFPAISRPAFRFRVPTRVHHYHWTDSLAARLRIRLATPGVSKAGGDYGAKQLAHIERHDGIALDQITVAAPGSAQDWRRTLRSLRWEGRLRSLLAPATDRYWALRNRMGR